MSTITKQCGISGKPFEADTLCTIQDVPANGESEAYVRLVSVEALGLSEDEVKAGQESGEIKPYSAFVEAAQAAETPATEGGEQLG